ncbi:MAG TPA: phosphotransferase [Smithellaceae bacterium]|nr:phosphotransferase [Smithellaceae bacterium]HRS90227.1 phosphotransferase [Smithellaceae bacterium]HRV26332.1 phosphotransferase [Smithellaceae bacterium]
MNKVSSTEPTTTKTIKSVALRWGINLKKTRDDIAIAGSPERALLRLALEDDEGKLFVLEQIPAQSLERKKNIAATLDCLSRNGLRRIQPYLADATGVFVVEHENCFWQITPFVPGVALDRGNYMYEKWRGPALANFLIEMRAKAKNLHHGAAVNIFSLKNYIYKLIREINLYNKDIRAEINGIAGFLEKEFLPAYDKLPVAFSHGDYHPLNIIWSVDDITCIIDWEFCGYKSELYDAALLIGCVGVEDPRALTGELVKSFISAINDAGIITRESQPYLTEFIAALRFAWLAEWLRQKDGEMIRLELDYMRLLIENKYALEKAWPR